MEVLFGSTTHTGALLIGLYLVLLIKKSWHQNNLCHCRRFIHRLGFLLGFPFCVSLLHSAFSTLSLLRDPQIVKDPNAIKIVSADSGCSKFLGYLPRELAQYISPMIDEYGLVFQSPTSLELTILQA